MALLLLTWFAVKFQRQTDTNNWFDGLEQQWQDRQDYYQNQKDY